MRAWVGIGSNLGDRIAACQGGASALAGLPGTRCEKVSCLYLTEPVGLSGCEWFLNAVAELETSLPPRDLLEAMLAIERTHGRRRGKEPAPRTLDLDLLDAGGRRCDEDRLTLPHPRLHLRRFQLLPLAEIAPTWRHPRLGRTASELLAGLADRSRVVRIARLERSAGPRGN
jgi:2-amino-4-hydroxy-6-hydroxymethyldihydropteridine diphosphokinase